MQKLRQFVSVLFDFLQHKAPFIEELEEQIQESNKQRASAITKRRSSDSEDEMMELEDVVSAAKSVNERGSSLAIISAATNAAESAAATIREQTNMPVKLDEFGRDENLKKCMDMKRRAEARHRWKARSESKKLSSMEIDGSNEKIEGELSTDESMFAGA